MKKSVRSLVSIIILLVLFLITLASILADAETTIENLVYDDFDDSSIDTSKWTVTTQDGGTAVIEFAGDIIIGSGSGFAHTGGGFYTTQNFSKEETFTVNLYNWTWNWVSASTKVGQNGVFFTNSDCYSGTDCRDTQYYGSIVGDTVFVALGNSCAMSGEGVGIFADDGSSAWHCTWEETIDTNNSNIFTAGNLYDIEIVFNVVTGEINVSVDGSEVASGTVSGAKLTGLGDNIKIETHLSHYPYNSNTHSWSIDAMSIDGPLPIVPCNYNAVSTDTTLSANSESCYNVTSPNTELDCAGYNVSAVNHYDFAVVTDQSNVTVKNCVFRDETKGIRVENTDGFLSFNNSFIHTERTDVNNSVLVGIEFLNSTDSDVDLNIFDNYTMVHDGDEPSLGFIAAYKFTNSSNIRVNNSNASNFAGTDREYSSEIFSWIDVDSGHFVILEDSEDITFNNSLFDNSNNGLQEGFGNTNIKYEEFVFNLCKQDDSLSGFHYDKGLFNNSASSLVSMGGSNALYSNNQFQYVTDTDFGGFHVSVLSISNNVSFVNNTFRRLDDGSGLTNLADNSVIENNTFLGMYQAFTQGGAVFVGGENVSVKGNYFNGTAMTASRGANIYIDDSARFVTIENNYINNTVNGYGITFFQTDNVTSKNNTWNRQTTLDRDILLYRGNDIYSIDDNRNKSQVLGVTPALLYNGYTIRVNVTDGTNPLPSNVTVYNVSGTQINTTTTDGTGLSEYFIVYEYTQTDDATYVEGCTGSGANIHCLTPHNFTANSSGSFNNTFLSISEPQTVHIVIAESDPCVYGGSGNFLVQTICFFSNEVVNVLEDLIIDGFSGGRVVMDNANISARELNLTKNDSWVILNMSADSVLNFST